ncbi:MAG TPA: ATP-dependent RecD-like DNA helicase [Chitinispirillaceae bacterium]|nr:ATP-dependent RecD-like DNA helicase [Chitinispirillaceae bacterium]
MIKLSGVAGKITFRNDTNGFTVFQLKEQPLSLPVICIGIMPTINSGESITVEGEWQTSIKFGKQFAVHIYHINQPDTIDGIKKFLLSGILSNVGPVRTEAIVEKFGLETLSILDSAPQRLLEVSGIGEKTLDKIKESWYQKRYLKNLILFLAQHDISTSLALKLSKIYGSDAQRKVAENPYVLISDVRGVGFIKADQIAQKMGYSRESVHRIKAGILFTLQESLKDGHSCYPREELITLAAPLLEVDKEKVAYSLDDMVAVGSVVQEQEFIYVPAFYAAEKYITKNVKNRIEYFEDKSIKGTAQSIEIWIKQFQERNGWTGDIIQIKAITTAVSNPLFLCTGGPGTGKTTILKVICAYFSEMGCSITLTAPTGRAAERMSYCTGIGAKTIHRLLGYNAGSDDSGFQKNEGNLLETDVIIIDEVSMVDLLLMRSLLAAVPLSAHIILIGDNKQLPSVGPGNVLSDFISSQVIPHVHLQTVFRQAAQSRIVTAAHEIIKGAIPVFQNRSEDNCFFVSRQDPQESVDYIIDLVSRRLPEKYNLDPVKDIQVLSPMHKGLLGTINLNSTLQTALNTRKRKLVWDSVQFIEGDKVMQVKNDYERGIFNGDMGIVTRVIDDDSLGVKFQESEVEYTKSELEEIQPAYCISIHKSQGCEFNAVVIPISTQHYVMLQRNLIYTALTRAKTVCVLIGTPNALSIAVRNDKALRRYSQLASRLSAI